MIRSALVLLASLLASSLTAATAACPNGVLTPAAAPYDGPPVDVLKRHPAMRSAVQQVLKDQPDWLLRLQGVAGPTRRFASSGTALIVVSVCQPHACPDFMLYGVWSPQAGAFAGMLWRDGQWQALGTLDAPARAAIACATAEDNAEADEVRAYFDRTPLVAPWTR